jgi:hypothetical protein
VDHRQVALYTDTAVEQGAAAVEDGISEDDGFYIVLKAGDDEMDGGYDRNAQAEDELSGCNVENEDLRGQGVASSDQPQDVAKDRYAENKVDHADGYMDGKVTGT